MGLDRSRNARLVAVTGLFVYTSANAYLSAGLGAGGREVGLSETQVGIILSLGALSSLVTAPFWGSASDRLGRRRLILFAMPVVAFGPLVMALVFGNAAALTVTTIYLALLGARTIQAAFGGALIPVTQAYLADMTGHRQRVTGMGLMSASVGAGTVCGTLLLWLAAGHGLALGFAIIAGTGLAALVCILALLPEAPGSATPLPDELRVPYGLVWPYIAITFIGFTAYTMITPIISLRLMDQGNLDTRSALGQAGIVLTIASVALLLSQSVVAAREGWDTRLLLRVGSLGALIGIGALALVTSLAMTVAAMLVVGAALGFVGPANLGAISLATGSQAQGRVAGVNAAARGLGIAVGPITGTLLYRATHVAPFLGAFLLVGLIVILSWLPMRGSRREAVL